MGGSLRHHIYSLLVARSWVCSQFPLAPCQAPDDQAKELAEKLTDRNPNGCSAQGQVGQAVSAQDAWLGCLVCCQCALPEVQAVWTQQAAKILACQAARSSSPHGQRLSRPRGFKLSSRRDYVGGRPQQTQSSVGPCAAGDD